MTKQKMIFLALGLGALAACQGDPKADDSGPPVQIESSNMIDDFEDGNGVIISQGLRAGDWFTYKDDTPEGTLTPVPDGEVKPEKGEDGGYYLHLSGSGFKDWGAGAGFHLAFDGNAGRPGLYDLSSFEGIAFDAKGNAPVSVAVSLPAVLPPVEGGTCMDNAMMTLCHDVHKREVRLTNEWKQYKVKFSDLKQDGYSGMPVSWDPTMAMAIQFDVSAGAFELFLDNIGLY